MSISKLKKFHLVGLYLLPLDYAHADFVWRSEVSNVSNIPIGGASSILIIISSLIIGYFLPKTKGKTLKSVLMLSMALGVTYSILKLEGISTAQALVPPSQNCVFDVAAASGRQSIARGAAVVGGGNLSGEVLCRQYGPGHITVKNVFTQVVKIVSITSDESSWACWIDTVESTCKIGADLAINHSCTIVSDCSTTAVTE